MTRVLRRLKTIHELTRGQDQQVDVLIIGAGPTGLGAAKRLDHLVCSCSLWESDTWLTY
jgi:ribulose 1,5-bisphosphate synthetase/thiazole synthase